MEGKRNTGGESLKGHEIARLYVRRDNGKHEKGHKGKEGRQKRREMGDRSVEKNGTRPKHQVGLA